MLSTSGTPEQQSQFSALLGISIVPDPEIQAVKGQEKKCVKLRGLPYQCGPEAVIDFFGPLKNDIASKGVHMVLNANVSTFAYEFISISLTFFPFFKLINTVYMIIKQSVIPLGSMLAQRLRE